MKINKMKIARLTEDQAKSIKGGILLAAASTQHAFTCGWCTGDDTITFEGCPGPTDPRTTSRQV